MIYLGDGLYYNNSISHHGIKGQRWGVRNGTRHTRTTFKNCFNEWEHGYVSKKWGEQARGYDQ